MDLRVFPKVGAERRAEIDKKAAWALSRYGYDPRLDDGIDVVIAAKRNGVSVGLAALPAGTDMFVKAEADGAPVIGVSERLGFRRKRALVGHALGHILLHRVRGKPFSRYDGANWGDGGAQEQEADRFASALLMPEESFLRRWREMGRLPRSEAMIRLARIYGVSLEQVLRRADDLEGT